MNALKTSDRIAALMKYSYVQKCTNPEKQLLKNEKNLSFFILREPLKIHFFEEDFLLRVNFSKFDTF